MYIGVCNFSPAMWPAVLISCMLLLLQVSAKPEFPVPKYLVLFPSQVQSLESAEVCIHVFESIRPFTLTLTLETNNSNQTIFADKVLTLPRPESCNSYYKCSFFKAPPVKVTADYMRGTVSTLYVTGTDVQKRVIVNEGKQLLILKRMTETIIQTDKPIYKQGEKVGCRIVSLDSKFLASNDVYPLVELQDPQGNRIGQWLNLKPNQGIAELSFKLTSEAMLGDYNLHGVKTDGDNIYASFTVAKYVLPKFETLVNGPERITTLDRHFEFAICGRYTFGQSAKGIITATVCRNTYYWGYYRAFPNEGNSICQYFSGKTDNNGCFTAVCETEPFLNVTQWSYQMQLDITATLEEAGTGIKVNGAGTIPISQTLVTVQFQNVSSYYRTDYPFSGQILMQDAYGKGIPNRRVYLTSQYSNYRINKTLTTDSKGIAYFSLTTSNWSSSINLRASYLPGEPIYSGEYSDGYHYLEEFYSNTKSSLLIKPQYKEFTCGMAAVIWVNYVLSFTEVHETSCQAIYYMVITRGSIISTGRHGVSIPRRPRSDIKGSFSISFPTSSDTSPTARVLVYSVVNNGGVMADSFDFKVSKCFKNKVGLQFSKSKVLPGSKLSLNIKAAAGSLCGLRAVDKSVLLLKPETELTADLIYNRLPVQDTYGYPYEVYEYESYSCNQKRRPYFYYQPYMDTSRVFQNTGTKYITNCNMKKPVDCSQSIEPQPYLSGDVGAARPVAAMKLQAESPNSGSGSKPRTNFNETWLWQLEPLPSGGKTISLTIPDTITEWKANMFCTAPIGFGLSDTASVITFKQLFVEPALPYSMVRGETVNLIVKVFSYVPGCVMVRITLANSTDYVAVPCTNCQYTSCLCANEDKTVSWNITPKKLGVTNFTITAEAIQTKQLCNGSVPVVPHEGSSDTVIKSLTVEPEGIPVQLCKTSLICPNGTSVSDVFIMQPPANAVEGSTLIRFQFVGDVMGIALSNIENLLSMPYGCGEQNMLGFSTDTSILHYLKSTNQLTDIIKEKGISFLQSGYQTELNYKRKDGSFSAFGDSDKDGSLWLTVHVCSQFVKASDFISIDPLVIDGAIQWISQHQMADGCFENVGKLYHTAMKGGVNDNLSLSAFVCYSLQEIPEKTPTIELLINNTLTCLRNATSNVTSSYTMALLANVFRYPEDASRRKMFLDKLEQMAIKEGGLIHWETPNSVPVTDSYWNPAPSSQVELAGYVVLSFFYNSVLTESELGFVSGIIRWIAKQQQNNGGFENTQDTVVGFAALGKYGAYIGIDTVQANINIYREQTKLTTIQINDVNRLLLQDWFVRNAAGNYTTEVTGKGCVLLQGILQYNIHSAKNLNTFFFEVSTSKVYCEPQPRFNINATTRYIGDRNVTNMIIIQIKMLTGVSPDLESLEELKQQHLVKNVEYSDSVVTIYLDELMQGQTEQYVFTVNQDVPVSNQQPSSAKIQDYYQTEEKAETTYNGPCNQAAP
ncbi:alpha-2-macroglobulin-like protein 1 [Protopterus annectens]|uniref:alpha-2-macroglobulin-like protein 1 n=1 Tax=Protopterus annectens TaxID=7888 RepID=UPI001CF93053|nr:alpha-2-macroglobulin-like protein 1 [Protopterus annectens]